MPYKVTIKTGLKDVVIGGQGPFQGGDVVLLTDEQFAAMRPGGFAALFQATPVPVNTGDINAGYPYS
jgi:hypothetical protein